MHAKNQAIRSVFVTVTVMNSFDPENSGTGMIVIAGFEPPLDGDGDEEVCFGVEAGSDMIIVVIPAGGAIDVTVVS